MSKNKMLFCSNCGERYKIKEKICSKCKRKLPVKSKLIINYLKKEVKNEIKGNMEDKLVELIKQYIKSHLYGVILTISLITTCAAVVTTEIIDSNKYERVTSRPQLKLEEPAADYTILDNVLNEYWKMVLTNNLDQKKFIYLDNNQESYTGEKRVHEILQDRSILSKDASLVKIMKIKCTNKELTFEDMYVPESMGGECTYYINYCRDDSCSGKESNFKGREELAYDYTLEASIYYLRNYHGQYFIIDDIITTSKDNIYRVQFYKAKGDINLFFENLVYPESAV